MTDFLVVNELREYLVAQGVVRRWGDAPNGLPQCTRDPRDGLPEPVDHTYQGATVMLVDGGKVPQPALEEFIEEALIDCTTRAYSTIDAQLIQRRIRAVLDGFYNFMMNGLIVEHVQMFTGDAPLGSDELGYTRMQTFRVRARVKALAGLQYW